MVVGKFSDPEWKLQFFACSFYYLGVWSFVGATLGYWLFVACGRAIAGMQDETTMPDALGFWLRGNTSFLTEYAMNRTDLNETSPTYLRWTPPPEWRDYCIQSSGMPISACSYFQYQEYPAFMTFFYVAMYSLEVLMFCIVLYWTTSTMQAFADVLSKIRKSEGGLVSLLTWWGNEKNPFITQSCYLRFSFCLGRFTSMQGLRVILIYLSCLYAPGFGLLNSSGTGMWYLGSSWNEAPVPSLEEMFATGAWRWGFGYLPFVGLFGPGAADLFGLYIFLWIPWKAHTFLVPTTSSWAGIDPASDFSYQVLNPYFVLMFMMFNMMKKSNEKDMEANNHMTLSVKTRLFGHPKDWSPSTIIKWARDIEEMAPMIILVSFAGIYNQVTVWICGGAITGPEFAGEGEAGMVKWLYTVFFGKWYCFLAYPILHGYCVNDQLRDQFRKAKDSQHLMSAHGHKRHLDSLWGMRYRIFALESAYLLLHSPLVVPAGCAMQMYGITPGSVWPSPMNALFSRPGQAQNLLGSPVLNLCWKLGTLICLVTYTKITVSRPKTTKTKPTRVGA